MLVSVKLFQQGFNHLIVFLKFFRIANHHLTSRFASSLWIWNSLMQSEDGCYMKWVVLFLITRTVLNATEFCITSLLECVLNYSHAKSSSQTRTLLKKADADEVGVRRKCDSKVFQTQFLLWQCCVNVLKCTGYIKGNKSL